MDIHEGIYKLCLTCVVIPNFGSEIYCLSTQNVDLSALSQLASFFLHYYRLPGYINHIMLYELKCKTN